MEDVEMSDVAEKDLRGGSSVKVEGGEDVELAPDRIALEPLSEDGQDDPETKVKAEPQPAEDARKPEENGTEDGGKEHERERKRDRKESRKERSRERRRSREKTDDRERDRDRDKDRHRDRSKDRSHKRSRDDRDRERDSERDRDGEKSRRSKSREKSSRRSRSREHRSRRDRSYSRDRKHRRRSRSRGRRRSPSLRRRSSPRRRRTPSPFSRRRSRSRGFSAFRRRRSPHSSEEGFGGYVPRKRQEDPAPAGYSAAFIDPYAALRSKKPLPTDPEGIKRSMREQQLRARQMVLQQQASSAVAAASKTQREIYVGNLVQGLVTEDSLRQLFNTTMKAAFPEGARTPGEPCVSVSMHSEGRYAFVELKSSEMASAALQLSGQVQLLGQNISVGRPSGYVDPSAAQMAAAQAATALQAFEAGGMTLEQAEEAMNSIHMPGATSASAPPTASPQGNLALPSPPPAAPPGGLPGPPAPQGEFAPPAGPTPFLQVEGMVTADVLMGDAEYAEIIEDLQDECGKYGQILQITIPRPPNPEMSQQLFGTNNYGKAFIQFADADAAGRSKNAIHGRLFLGITVQANFVTPAAFQSASSQ